MEQSISSEILEDLCGKFVVSFLRTLETNSIHKVITVLYLR